MTTVKDKGRKPGASGGDFLGTCQVVCRALAHMVGRWRGREAAQPQVGGRSTPHALPTPPPSQHWSCHKHTQKCALCLESQRQPRATAANSSGKMNERNREDKRGDVRRSAQRDPARLQSQEGSGFCSSGLIVSAG